jgi:uncharacterized repeat protein (TIGR04076 family)
MVSKVKITVIKMLSPRTVFGVNIPKDPMTGKEYEICPIYKDGQEFIVSEKGEMPAGFCSWAWHDIYKDVSVLMFGGNFPWVDAGVMYTCCTDGTRPVSFKLERLKE